MRVNDLQTAKCLQFTPGLKRSSEIITENYFSVRHKNRRNYNQSFKLLFFNINLHIGSQKKNKCSPHKQYLLCHLFTRNAKKTQMPNYTARFYTLSEKKRPTNLHKQQLWNILSRKRVFLVQLASMNNFLFHVINRTHYFLS